MKLISWLSYLKLTYWADAFYTGKSRYNQIQPQFFVWKPLKLVSAIFHCFWKNNVFLGYFERNPLKGNLTDICFIFHCFTNIYSLLSYHALPAFLKPLFLTVCVMETMLVTLWLVQMNKARREVSQQIKHKSR